MGDYQILEPLDYYNNFLKDKFAEETKKYFDELFSKSGVDVKANQKLVGDYKRLLTLRENADQDLKKQKVYKIFLIAFEVFLGIIFLTTLGDGLHLGHLRFLLIMGGVFYYHFKIKNKKIEELQGVVNNFDRMINEAKDKCFDSMEGLNKLFTREMTFNMIRDLVPLIKLDYNFDIKRFEQLVKAYNFEEEKDKDHTTLDLVSGDILGNPFVFVKDLVHEKVLYTYSGTRTVNVQVSYRDSDGDLRYRTESQTLYADIQRPGPKYTEKITLVYGNEAAPNLSFSRVPGDPEEDDKLINKLFSSNKKKLKKAEKEAQKEGRTFQPMTNEVFDGKFAAFDRDNEPEFRLLFTALGQENMLKFLENDVYGDDLYFSKDKMVNTIYCTHTDDWDIDNKSSDYKDFDFYSCKDKFFKRNTKYFQDFYFAFLPILSIPVYQQNKARDYIYKNSYAYNYNSYTREMAANAIDPRDVSAEGTGTPTIIKTKTLKSMEGADFVQVDAYSYQREERIEYVQKMARDGNYYNVEVPWTKYIPVSRTTTMVLLNTDMDENTYNNFKYDQAFNQEMKNFSGGYAYKNRLFAALTDSGFALTDERIKKLLKI